MNRATGRPNPRKDRDESRVPGAKPTGDKRLDPSRPNPRPGGSRPAAGGKPQKDARWAPRKRPTAPKDDAPYDRKAPRGNNYKGKNYIDQTPEQPSGKVPEEGMRLNKYLAHAGIASRRKCDEHIADGLVKVNGKVVLEMGYKVQPKDKISFNGKSIDLTKEFFYILLNKPKNYITTTSDERDRKTVMQLVKNATDERIYPVGRLDRQTTGLLLLTNDGELAQKMTHPKNGVKKVYHVTLNKDVTEADMEAIAKGLTLEDGEATVDQVAYADIKKRNEIGIEIHIGKNRIVRRIFEHLGYTVEKLDRVFYAGLVKKDLPRGRWRMLSDREIVMLKHFT